MLFLRTNFQAFCVTTMNITQQSLAVKIILKPSVTDASNPTSPCRTRLEQCSDDMMQLKTREMKANGLSAVDVLSSLDSAI